jgi:hypothetical protein
VTLEVNAANAKLRGPGWLVKMKTTLGARL